jgi:hypothetical protein
MLASVRMSANGSPWLLAKRARIISKLVMNRFRHLGSA